MLNYKFCVVPTSESHASSLGNREVDQEITRPVGDFPWLGSVLQVPFSVLTMDDRKVIWPVKLGHLSPKGCKWWKKSEEELANPRFSWKSLLKQRYVIF